MVSAFAFAVENTATASRKQQFLSNSKTGLFSSFFGNQPSIRFSEHTTSFTAKEEFFSVNHEKLTVGVLPHAANRKEFCATFLPGAVNRLSFCAKRESGTDDLLPFTSIVQYFIAKEQNGHATLQSFCDRVQLFCVRAQKFPDKVQTFCVKVPKYIARAQLFCVKGQKYADRVRLSCVTPQLFCARVRKFPDKVRKVIGREVGLSLYDKPDQNNLQIFIISLNYPMLNF